MTLEAHSPQRARTPRSRQARPHPWKRLEPQLRWWGRENYEKDRRAARPTHTDIAMDAKAENVRKVEVQVASCYTILTALRGVRCFSTRNPDRQYYSKVLLDSLRCKQDTALQKNGLRRMELDELKPQTSPRPALHDSKILSVSRSGAGMWGGG